MSTSSKLATKKYRIGITADVNEAGDFAFFTNGLRQNVLFLCKMFAASPDCFEVILMINRLAKSIPPNLGIDQLTSHLIDPNGPPLALDYLLVAGTAVDPNHLKAYRAAGTKTIFYKGGNAAIISIESAISATPDKDGERYGDYDCYDEVWMTPQHEHTYKGWCETIYRCPVRIVPQIWEPSFLGMQSQQVQDDFGYKPGKGTWKLGILDPNITVMKTSHMPILVCEHAFRLQPEKIEAIYVTNAIQFAQNNHFAGFINLMTASKAGKMTVEGRFVTWEFLTNFCNAVVTHHWENGLNYLFYEVLYGGYPLIHNSEFLKEYGYYYPSFEPELGGRAVVEAFENHDKNHVEYREKGVALAAKLSPTARHNIDLHEGLLRAIT
jgi:Protein of unknown function (DUF2827)